MCKKYFILVKSCFILAVFILASCRFLKTDQETESSDIGSSDDVPGWCTGEDVPDVALDAEGRLYAGTGAGLGISKDLGNNFVNATLGNGLSTMAIMSLQVGDDNTIYAGGPVAQDCSSCGYDPAGISVSTDRGNTFTYHEIAKTKSSIIIQDLFIDESKTLYAIVNGPEGGLAISDDGAATFDLRTTTNSGLASNAVYSVFAKNGTIYVGTAIGLSVSHDDGQTFSTLGTANGLPQAYVLSVYEDQGILYAGTTEGLAISKNGGQSFEIKKTKHGLPADKIYRIAGDGNGAVYFATDKGLAKTTNAGESFASLAGLTKTRNTRIHNIFVNGETVVLGTKKGVAYSEDGGKSFRKMNHNSGLGSYLESSGNVRVDDKTPGVF